MAIEKTKLTKYYKNLPKLSAPKTDFVNEIAEECGVNVQTVRFWLSGKSKPSTELAIEVLAKRTGIPSDELFNID